MKQQAPRRTVVRDLAGIAIFGTCGSHVRSAAQACVLAVVATTVGAVLPSIAAAQVGPDAADSTGGGAGTLDAILGGATGVLVFGLLQLALVLARRSNGNSAPERAPPPAPQIEIDFPDPSWTPAEKAEALEAVRRNDKRLEDMHKWLDPEGGRIQDNIREIRNAVVKSGTND